MVTITRKLWFSAGHRVLNHESKCNNPHGHNYVLYITARQKEDKNGLDNLGRVIDFSVLKELVNDWIQKNFDHTCLIYKKDIESLKAYECVTFNKMPYIMNENPTAENIANHLLKDIIPVLLKDTDIEVFKIKLYETENNYVEVSNE